VLIVNSNKIIVVSIALKYLGPTLVIGQSLSLLSCIRCG